MEFPPIKQTVNLGVHEGIRLEVRDQEGGETVYEIVQLGFGQDDGMAGNIVVRCISNPSNGGASDTLSYIGMSEFYEDFGEQVGGSMKERGEEWFVDEAGVIVGKPARPYVRIAPTAL